MQLHTILVVLPSGNHNLLNLSDNYINTLVNNTGLINGFIGPLLNANNIESNDTYHIYCTISKQNLQVNNLLTKFISRQVDDYFVNGDAYVIKKYDNDYMNIIKEDILDILDILNTTINFNIKIQSVETITSNIIDNNKINYENSEDSESNENNNGGCDCNPFCCC